MERKQALPVQVYHGNRTNISPRAEGLVEKRQVARIKIEMTESAARRRSVVGHFDSEFFFNKSIIDIFVR